MEPICDYLGNEINEGMAVCKIRTIPIYGDITVMKPKKNGKGYFKEKVIYKQPKSCWSCVGEYAIKKGEDGKLRHVIDSEGFTFESLLDNIYFDFQKGDLLTIKGVSDKQISSNQTI